MCFNWCRKKKVVEDFNKVSKEASVWEGLRNKMSSWSLPKSNKSKEEFEMKFEKYLALDPGSSSTDKDDDSVSSTLSELLG